MERFLEPPPEIIPPTKLTPTRVAPVKLHAPLRRAVHAKLEDVGAGVMADGVEIELGAGNVGKVERGDEDSLLIVHGTSKAFAERRIDRASAAAKDVGKCYELGGICP